MTLPDPQVRQARAAREAERQAATAHLFPRCAVCDRRVSNIAWTIDPATPGVVTVKVACHGAEETLTLPRAIGLAGEIPGDTVFVGAASNA